MQLDALRRAGVTAIFEEKASGVSERPLLRECLGGLRPGDVFVFWRLDRVARRLGDLVAIEEDLRARDIALRSLTEPFDTTTPVGVCMFQTLGAFAQLERATIRERVLAGQVAHLQRGGSHGRPRQLSDLQQAEVQSLALAGHTQADIARRMAVSRAVVDRVVNPWRPRYQPVRPVLGPLLAQSAPSPDAPK
ncbi:recombinase family protein [Acidovorax sp. GBBC 3334]|nr:recombinase family protein [Acidovorax sp. GBBC 3334]